MKNKFKVILQTLFFISYLAVGIIGFFAEIKGFQVWFNMPFILAIITSLFLTYIPIVGNFAMYYGMVDGWGWSKLLSFIISFLPFLLLAVGLIGSLILTMFNWIKNKVTNN